MSPSAVDPIPSGGALDKLRYLYPSLIFIAYIVASAISIVRLHSYKASKDPTSQTKRRRISLALIVSVVLTYVAQVVVLAVHSFATGASLGPESAVIGWLSAILIWGVDFAGLQGDPYPVWYIHLVVWLLALPFEATLLGLSYLAHYSKAAALDFLQVLDLSLSLLRICIILGLLGTYAGYLYGRKKEKATDEETQGLLPKDDQDADNENDAANGYGATDGAGGSGNTNNANKNKNKKTDKKKAVEPSWMQREREMREELQKRLEEDGNLFTYLKSFMIFWPHIWPAGNRSLQFRLLLIGVCMLATNSLNLLAPRQVGIIMDGLAGGVKPDIWLQIFFYIAFRVAAGECGIQLLRSWLLIPVRLYSNQALSTAAFSHIMHLSADFHSYGSTSDTLNAMFGGSRLTYLLENVLFTALPTFIDMILAFIYLSVILGPYEGLISVASGTMFVYVAARMVSRRDKALRGLEELQNIQWHTKVNGISGWPTVSSFNQIQYECNRYKDAVYNETDAKKTVQFSWQLSSAVQSLALLAGLAASASLAVYRIREGEVTAGQFAVLITYWAQLTSPLQYFINLSKSTKEDFIYCERLLRIMQTQPSVLNKASARPLRFRGGEVEFRNVSFGYDKKKLICENLNFRAKRGTVIALVGATGSGKSTILKLINRLYDVTDGAILIDDQDVRDVDLFSLRDRIGVVPQEPLLFADTIMYNVRYARLTASDEEVHEACKAAAMHDKIMTFTEGYDTFVGDRGVKLSGGERQRVAIARAILKNPDIVLLDEATSAVDTDTEQKIQESFARLCESRTTFVVAHRLSTVKRADRILVLGDGAVLEDGSHNELLALKGKYANLWMKQGFIRPETEEEKGLGIANDLNPDPEAGPILVDVAGDGAHDDGGADDRAGSSGSRPDDDASSVFKGKQPVASVPASAPAPAPASTPDHDTGGKRDDASAE